MIGWGGSACWETSSLSEDGVCPKVTEVGRGFTDWVAVDGKPGVEDRDVEEWFSLCEGVEWMSEVVDMEGERGAVELDDADY